MAARNYGFTKSVMTNRIYILVIFLMACAAGYLRGGFRLSGRNGSRAE